MKRKDLADRVIDSIIGLDESLEENKKKFLEKHKPELLEDDGENVRPIDVPWTPELADLERGDDEYHQRSEE